MTATIDSSDGDSGRTSTTVVTAVLFFRALPTADRLEEVIATDIL